MFQDFTPTERSTIETVVHQMGCEAYALEGELAVIPTAWTLKVCDIGHSLDDMKFLIHAMGEDLPGLIQGTSVADPYTLLLAGGLHYTPLLLGTGDYVIRAQVSPKGGE